MNENRDPVKVVVVDDSPQICKTISLYLKGLECVVSTFQDPRKCLDSLRKNPADIIIMDLRMPQMHGLELLRQVKSDNQDSDVIIITGFGDKNSAIEALRAGAFDFFEKPVCKDELVETVRKTLRYQTAIREKKRLEQQLSYLSKRDARKWGIDAFVGRTESVQKILDDIRALQKADRTSVLILGESGTGKELVARAIHFGGSRSARPWVPLNCAAIPGELAESNFFGHEKGAFTGATAKTEGSFQMADGGTVFLDEISAMPLNLQPKLLRVLEDHKVTPVGSTSPKSVDVRMIAAANHDLYKKVEIGEFRQDLFHRLAVYTVSLPPLRERKDDIALLARHFVVELSLEMGLKTTGISKAALEFLREYDYPGNIRELRNSIERALIVSCGKEIQPGHITFQGSRQSDEMSADSCQKSTQLPFNIDQAEIELIRRALSRTEGNVTQAAKLLGISRTSLYRKIASSSDKKH